MTSSRTPDLWTRIPAALRALPRALTALLRPRGRRSASRHQLALGRSPWHRAHL